MNTNIVRVRNIFKDEIQTQTQILSGFTSLNGFKNIRNQIDEVIKNLLDETKEDCDEDCQKKLKKIVQRSLQGVSSQILEPHGLVGILQNLCFYNILSSKLMKSSQKGEDWHEGDAGGVHV